MSKASTKGQLFPVHVAEALVSVAVRQYGPSFLDRGGPVNRARAEVSRGRSTADAARLAAKQGKGHMAELRVASEHTIDSGLRGSLLESRPNAVANDPVADIEVLLMGKRISGAQVGVGSPAYIRNKVNTSRASKIVVNSEARNSFANSDKLAYDRSSDRLHHEGTTSSPLRSAQVEDEATRTLEGVLLSSPNVPSFFQLEVVATAGMKSAASSFSRTLLLRVVERLHRGMALDRELVDEAIGAGVDGFFKASVQTYLQTSQFLDVAGACFDSRLLKKLGGRVVIASAIADVVIETARDIISWVRGELTFEDVARRAGVTICASGGAVAGWVLASRTAAGMGPIAALALTLAGSWAGARLGEWIGEELFLPISRAPKLAGIA